MMHNTFLPFPQSYDVRDKNLPASTKTAQSQGAPQESILIMGHNRSKSQRPHWVALMSTHTEQNNAISRLAASHGVVMEKSGDTLAAATVFCRGFGSCASADGYPWWPLLQTTTNLSCQTSPKVNQLIQQVYPAGARQSDEVIQRSDLFRGLLCSVVMS